MKIAISIPDELFREVERFAEEHQYSRSEVFAVAVKEFFEKAESLNILNALNAAYFTEETAEEKTLKRKGKERYFKKVLKEPF